MSQHDDRVTALDRNDALVGYISSASTRTYPEEIKEGARRALVDYLGVAVGASDDPVARPIRKTVESWGATGRSRVFVGGTTTAALAAFANATAAHAMDYDDTHPMGGGHPSGPCWSTVFAVADELGNAESQALSAFVTGYEIMARLGGGGASGVGRSLQRAGLHPTSVFGRTAAAAAACVLMGLNKEQISNALGVAATTAGGLLGSFGTHGKPFHSGKAAMDGILAAQLAANGFLASPALYEVASKGGILRTFIQKETPDVPPLDFEDRWELLGNAFKLFASCRGTHPSAQAAQSVAAKVAGRKIAKVHARVHPNSLVAAGNLDPKTPLQGKFSVPFCIALGLRGYRLVDTDFAQATMQDRSVMELVPRIVCEAVADQPNYEAHLEITFEDGTTMAADTAIVIGHPDNPAGWPQLQQKFLGLVEPILGVKKSHDLYDLAKEFDTHPGSLAKISRMLAA